MAEPLRRREFLRGATWLVACLPGVALAGCSSAAGVAPSASSAPASATGPTASTPAAGTAAASSASAPPVAGASSGKPLEKVQVSVAAKTANYGPFFVAMDKGYYAEEGIEIDLLAAGGGVATPALMSGTLPYSTSSDSALSAILKGAPLRVVYTNQDRNTQEVWALPDVSKLQDLEGKTIGLSTRGDSNEVSTRLLLTQNGVDPDSVSYTALGAGSLPAAALQGGSVAAAVISVADALQIQTGNLQLHKLADFQNVRVAYVGMATAATEIQQNPDRLTRILRGVAKGREYYKAFKDQTVQILGKYSGFPQDANELDYDTILAAMTPEGSVPADVQRADVAGRAQLLNVPDDKIPPLDSIYSYGTIMDVYKELKASGWKPQP